MEKSFQFPLLGFLFCIALKLKSGTQIPMPPFNSLYWDFCSVSVTAAVTMAVITVTFNSLYWDFCSVSSISFSKETAEIEPPFNSLYWDFCSVSPEKLLSSKFQTMFTFNSLYWDFCSVSGNTNGKVKLSSAVSFNSLYWDFCSVSINAVKRHFYGADRYFQFPLLGFLFCIRVPV